MARTNNLGIKKKKEVKSIITSGSDCVAIRIPKSLETLSVISKFKGIVGPSANKYNKISPTSTSDVLEELGRNVDYVLEGGDCEVGIESTIINLSNNIKKPIITRKGIISKYVLEKKTGYKFFYKKHIQYKQIIASPGSSVNHYCPNAMLFLMSANHIKNSIIELVRLKLKIGVLAFECVGSIHRNVLFLNAESDEVSYAKYLYKNLRKFDKEKADIILIEKLPNNEGWFAIKDRLKRSSFKHYNLDKFKILKILIDYSMH